MLSRRLWSKPRLIGPFFIISLVIGAALLLINRSLVNRELAKVPPPVLERQRLQGTGPEATVVPDPGFVCDHGELLKLSDDQTAKVQQIAGPYLRQKAALERHLQPAIQRFEQFQAKAQDSRHTNWQELQEHMGEVSQLSGELATLRERYWLQMREVLTADQRKRAEELWQRQLQRGKTQ